MKDGPLIANVAALIGDPARANILTALMDGRALTVTELTIASGVTMQTASGHLAKLREANLLTLEKQGRHHYFRLSAADVADVLEGLMNLAQRTGAKRIRTGPKDDALRMARVCYDHLAGERGVQLFARLVDRGLINQADDPSLTASGECYFSAFGININALKQGRRPLCRHCLDWSERRYHLGGALGAALFSEMRRRSWIDVGASRTVEFTKQGEIDFAQLLNG